MQRPGATGKSQEKRSNGTAEGNNREQRSTHRGNGATGSTNPHTHRPTALQPTNPQRPKTEQQKICNEETRRRCPRIFLRFALAPHRFFVYPVGHNGQNVLTPPTERGHTRRSETGGVCLREDDCAEMLCWCAFLIYPAADSQNRASRPPRPEMSERKRGKRDQHYGTKKKETAGTGTRTEKRKPRKKKKRLLGAGESRVQKGKTTDSWAQANRRRPRPKKGTGAALPPPTYRAESGA